jgi:hypothetical protein
LLPNRLLGTKLGVAYVELRDVTTGWSTKHQVLGKNVFNDEGETIGTIDDIIVAPDKAVSYAVIAQAAFWVLAATMWQFR